MFCAYPPIALPEPEQIRGRAGDLLLAHYLLGHNIGGNYESEQIRRALYFRVSALGHAYHRNEFLQDAWRSRPRKWCIDGHSVISVLRLGGEFGGQGGLVGF